MLKSKGNVQSLIGFVILAGLVLSSFGQEVPAFRKRAMNITVTLDGAPASGIEATISQVRHHFGFGGAMAYWPLDSAMILKQYNKKNPEDSLASYTEYIARYGDVAAKYEETYAKYFEWITPENEMKWTDAQYQRAADNYYKGDTLVAIAQRNDLRLRGHNLFWNEHMGWIPDWADSIAYYAWAGDAAYFDTGKAIINQRIEECLTHYKGQCAHWDVINEIVHGQVDTVTMDSMPPVRLDKTSGTLRTLTKMEDAAVYELILKKAAEVDNTTKFCLNDYNMISRWSRNDNVPDNYATLVNGMIAKGCKFDIIGCEGHFGNMFNDAQYTAATLKDNIDYIAGLIPNAEIWLTELDFQSESELQSAEWIATIMDVCFNHPRVGGIVLWTPYAGNRWRDTYTSYVIDTSLNEVPMGKTWREKIAAWKTNDTVVTTATGGKIAMTGVHGKYKVTFTWNNIPTEEYVYLEPGEGTVELTVPVNTVGIATGRQFASRPSTQIFINNQAVAFSLPPTEREPLFVKAYSLSGKLLATVPVAPHTGRCKLRALPAGCYLYKIGTQTKNYHTTVSMSIE